VPGRPWLLVGFRGSAEGARGPQRVAHPPAVACTGQWHLKTGRTESSAGSCPISSTSAAGLAWGDTVFLAKTNLMTAMTARLDCKSRPGLACLAKADTLVMHHHSVLPFLLPLMSFSVKKTASHPRAMMCLEITRPRFESLN
jgi:hypothetical protein